MRRRHDRNGFTLIELLIALGIVGALLAIAFGGLRVAMNAWTKGEDRAEVHQHLRGIAMVLGRAIGATHPYRGAVSTNDPTILFRGTAERVELVTQAPPLPAATPVAFTAMVIQIEREDDTPALVIRQRVLPNRDPFTEAQVALRDPGIDRLTLSYLNSSGAWQDTWDTDSESSLPRAIRMTVETRLGGRAETFPLTVALRATAP
ncbi:MAG TPA: type II secretion system protein GspJ [Methylomirabilota bacterium]|jgi:prepilin-type N-terminal cleavage/methylation domain-containing protein